MNKLTALTALAAVSFSLQPAFSQGMEDGDFFKKFEGRIGISQKGTAELAQTGVDGAAEAKAEPVKADLDTMETGSVQPASVSNEETEKAAEPSAPLATERQKSPALTAVSRAGKSKMIKLPGVEEPSFGVDSKATDVEVVKGVTGSSPKYSTIVSRYAASYGVPVSLAHAVISVESNYRSDARGSAGEVGLMQIKPATARMLGYSGSTKGLYDPDTNIRYGMKYLAMAKDLSDGSTCGTILKYNAGHGAKRMNPISAAYCSKVKRLLAN